MDSASWSAFFLRFIVGGQQLFLYSVKDLDRKTCMVGVLAVMRWASGVGIIDADFVVAHDNDDGKTHDFGSQTTLW